MLVPALVFVAIMVVSALLMVIVAVANDISCLKGGLKGDLKVGLKASQKAGLKASLQAGLKASLKGRAFERSAADRSGPMNRFLPS